MDGIALVIVAALVSWNDRVAVIVDGLGHVYGTDHVPERGHDQGNDHDQGSGHGPPNGKGAVVELEQRETVKSRAYPPNSQTRLIFGVESSCE